MRASIIAIVRFELSFNQNFQPSWKKTAWIEPSFYWNFYKEKDHVGMSMTKSTLIRSQRVIFWDLNATVRRLYCDCLLNKDTFMEFCLTLQVRYLVNLGGKDCKAAVKNCLYMLMTAELQGRYVRCKTKKTTKHKLKFDFVAPQVKSAIIGNFFQKSLWGLWHLQPS